MDQELDAISAISPLMAIFSLKMGETDIDNARVQPVMLVKRPDVSWKFLESLKAAVRQVLGGVDVAHLLDRLFLLDALP